MIEMQCRYCKSSNVSKDASAVWNKNSQQWVLGDLFDQPDFCADCGGETTIEAVPLDDETESNNSLDK